VLTASAAGEMHKLCAVFFAFIAQFVEDSLNVHLMEETLGSILKFADL
jgi:hypothetical protein